MRWCAAFLCLSLACLCGVGSSLAASFDGDARVEISDPSGSLSFDTTNQVISVSCWFKMSIPSDVTISEHMTVLADRTGGSETSDPFAYLIRYNVWNGNLEYVTRGNSSYTNTLIERPFVDRWYHVAVVRSGDSFSGYVDGREEFSENRSVGDSDNTDGVCIGSWGNVNYFYGEIQEVAIYQLALSEDFIVQYMYDDQPTSSVAQLHGYYKLGWSENQNDQYFNFAVSPPTGTTNGVRAGSGEIIFEETDESGEQSLFDSRKNGGRNALVPLSGSFTWQSTLLSRPTPGLPFEFRIGYSSANASPGFRLGGHDPSTSTMGKGWRHSFDARALRSDWFSPVAGLDTIGIMSWDGSIETWDWNYDEEQYKTRHGEYRGELELTGSYCQWTTPGRTVYKFRHPNMGFPLTMRGRLVEILDFNDNAIRLNWDETFGQVTQVVDSAGGSYTFSYSPQYLLTNVSYQGWNTHLEYDTSSQLVGVWTSGPIEYTNADTRVEFEYNSRNLMDLIRDPMGNVAVDIGYDGYGRKAWVDDARNKRTEFRYDTPEKRQVKTIDPADEEWIETYDRKHHVLSEEDPLGNTVSYEYDAMGNVVRLTDARGYSTTFAYDERSNRTVQTNALGQVTTWVYHDFFNKPIRTVNARGWTNYTVYDAGGNVLTNYDAMGVLGIFTYTSNGLLETSTDALGRCTRNTYNADGFLIARTDAVSNEWNFGVNELGWQVAATNPLGQVTRAEHDIRGKVVKTIDPLNREIISTYDNNGNVTSKSDAKGQYTYSYYNKANQVTQTVDRAGFKWRKTYDDRGKVLRSYDPYGKYTENTYDDAGRLVEVQDKLSKTSSIEYDANGNVTATEDRLNRRWTKTYDRLNRVVSTTDPLGNSVATSYDAVGHVVATTSSRGYSSWNEYDGRGRMTRWTDQRGFEWLYFYDPIGNITNITDPRGGDYVMTYGARNERLMERNQDGFEWDYAYDALLRMTNQIDPNGVVRAIGYDSAGRVDYVAFSTGRYDDYGYDDNDNPISLNRTGGGPPTLSLLSYDAMDRVETYTDPFLSEVSYTYDKAGRLETLAYPGGWTNTYQYDDAGRMTRFDDEDGRRTRFVYDNEGRLLDRKYKNGLWQQNLYDTAGRVTNLQHNVGGGNPFIEFRYGFDKNGNRVSEDEVGTLDWTLPDEIDETASYTPANRLIDRTDTLNTNRNFTYHYDPNGNMTGAVSAAVGYALTYDEDNRVMTLEKRTSTETNLVVNRYDALGRRVSRTLDGVETRYVLDLAGAMERVLCDMNSSGTILARYVHGPGGLAYSVDAGSGEERYYHGDGTGHIIAMTDSNQVQVSQYAFDPYGNEFPGTTEDANPYRYVGSLGVMKELDDLYFMRARYYLAEAGVFLSTDPVKNIGPGWRPSRHLYCDNNCIINVDPSGEIINFILSVTKLVLNAASTISDGETVSAKSGGGSQCSSDSAAPHRAAVAPLDLSASGPEEPSNFSTIPGLTGSTNFEEPNFGPLVGHALQWYLGLSKAEIDASSPSEYLDMLQMLDDKIDEMGVETTTSMDARIGIGQDIAERAQQDFRHETKIDLVLYGTEQQLRAVSYISSGSLSLPPAIEGGSQILSTYRGIMALDAGHHSLVEKRANQRAQDTNHRFYKDLMDLKYLVKYESERVAAGGARQLTGPLLF